MKKQTIFQLALAFLALGLFQNVSAQISLGVRAGMSLNNLAIDPLADNEPDPKPVLGVQLAIPVEIAIGDMFAVQPELMYATHGAKQDFNSTSVEGGLTYKSEVNSKINVAALEIPVLAKVKFGPEAFKFHVLAGPSFGFGLSGESSVKSNSVTTAADGTVIFSNTFEGKSTAKFVNDGYDESEVDNEHFAVAKTNLNLHLGAGVGVKVGAGSLVLDARYMLGLSDIAPDSAGTTKDDKTTAKSNRIGVTLGFFYPL